VTVAESDSVTVVVAVPVWVKVIVVEPVSVTVVVVQLVWVTVIYTGIYIQFSTSKIQTVMNCSLKAENKASLHENLYPKRLTVDFPP
jgi:hypothetical protein